MKKRIVNFYKEMAAHFSILAWRIVWTEKPGGLQSVGSQKLDTTEATLHTLILFFYYLVTSPLFRKLVGFIQVSPIENTLCKSYYNRNMCLNCESHSVMSDYLQLLDYTVHGILQARILKKVAFPLSRGSPQPRDWTQVSIIAGGFSISWAIGKPKNTGVCSWYLLHQIFLTQESNLGLLHWRQILYQLGYEGSSVFKLQGIN